MITNADATLYHRIRKNDGDAWKKVYLPEIWWFENIKSSLTINGLKKNNGTTNVLTVRIPDTTVEVQKGDYIVKGYCDIEMNITKDLSGIDHYCIEGVNYNAFGLNPHIKVVGT